ncbi:MAG: hypothetical protein R3F44_01140 [Candidatus Competibacteraceae bacterium]
MIEQLPSAAPAILGFKLQGKLHDQNYQTFVPTLEAAIAPRTAKSGCWPGSRISTAGICMPCRAVQR